MLPRIVKFSVESNLLGFILIAVIVSFPSIAISSEHDQSYLLAPQDILEISVWKDNDLTKKVIVRPDGKISFPLIGEVAVGGHTVQWLRNEIKQRINEYVNNPIVTVMVLKINGKGIYVVGKVERPGTSTIVRNINIMQALAIAGGLTPYANESNILILRYVGDDQIKIPFNYNEVKRGVNIEQNILLQDGDVIVVR